MMTPQEAKKAHGLSAAMRRELMETLHAGGTFSGGPVAQAVLIAHGYLTPDPWGDGLLLTPTGEAAARRFVKLDETGR